MKCKVHVRNIEVPRFTSGGGIIRLNMEVDRCTKLVRVWQSRHRSAAEIDLPTLAKMVVDHWAVARAREQQAEKKRRRLVRRGLLGCGCGG